MLNRFLFVCAGLALWLACAKGDARAEATPPASKAIAKSPAQAPPAGETVPAPPQDPPSASSPLTPLAEGKRIRITKLYEIKPLEIVVPPDVKLKMTFMDSDDILPRANLIGGGLAIEVLRPEEGFSTFADDMKMHRSGNATFVRAYEDEGGYLLLQKYQKTAAGAVFGIFVSRPQLKVTCRQFDMKSLADAELAASVCLSLRSAPKK
jgi:hypothetical protein